MFGKASRIKSTDKPSKSQISSYWEFTIRWEYPPTEFNGSTGYPVYREFQTNPGSPAAERIDQSRGPGHRGQFVGETDRSGLKSSQLIEEFTLSLPGKFNILGKQFAALIRT